MSKNAYLTKIVVAPNHRPDELNYVQRRTYSDGSTERVPTRSGSGMDIDDELFYYAGHNAGEYIYRRRYRAPKVRQGEDISPPFPALDEQIAPVHF